MPSNTKTKVYPWLQVSQDINKANKHQKPSTTKNSNQVLKLSADPIDDLVAAALLRGDLIARDSTGRKKPSPQNLSDFRDIYVWPNDVNPLLAQNSYIETWSPKSTTPRKHADETPKERAARFGWQVVIREEATRHCKEILATTGERTTIRALSPYLEEWAKNHGILTNRSTPPCSGSIRNALSADHWTMPR